MAVAHETVTYDVHDFKVYPLLTNAAGASPTYDPAVDVPGIAEVSMDPNIVSAVLKGDARVMARKARIDEFTLSGTYGKLDLDVLEVLIGGTTSDPSGSQANWTIAPGSSLPYFKAKFKIDDTDVGIGSVVVTLYVCQLTGGTLLGQSTDNFGQPTFQLSAYPAEDETTWMDVDIYDSVQTIS